MTTRHHNRPLARRPVHARLERKLRHDARTFDNPAEAAHFVVWTAQHWSRK